MNRNSFLASALVCALASVPLFAASYVVPPDDVFIRKSDTIVMARAITSYTVETPESDIQTVTEFVVDDALKGFAARTIHVAVPGGEINGRIKMVGGAPSFEAGEEYLLFLKSRANGDAILSDFGLGVFTFKDESGQRTVVRAAEVFGWNLDGSEHREVRRDADRFIEYIRSVVRGTGATADYALPGPVTPEPERHFQPKTDTTALAFTGNSYMLDCGGGMGCAWTGFPVNWNQGNTEPGAPGPVGQEGKTAITSGFAAWNGAGAGINYVYATNTANANGINDPSDHVNNVVFEKNVGTPYSCASGGLLGLGGIKAASGTHNHNGDSYFNTSEGDVSMNVGIANCTSLFSSGNFNSAVTHELGHTLGFRHADKTRSGSASCSGDPSLDCSSSAIMTAVITNGLSGTLQTWDRNAAQTVYGSGPVCTAPSISGQPVGSTINQGTSANLSVTAAGTSPFTYQWYIGNPPTTTTPVSPGGTTASISVSPASTTTYWVQVNNSCGPAVNSGAATITVNPVSCTAPQVTTQPQNQTITFGGVAQLSVVASGSATLTYQWYVGVKGNTLNPVLSGGTSANLAVTPSSTAQYWVRITNSCGSADSNAATVTVNCAAPSISVQPTNKTITAGSSTFLSVAASGGPNLTYQWYTGIQGDTSNPIPTGTTSTISVSPTTTTSYWVRVSVSGCGTADSQTATVTVNANNGCPAVAITTPTVTANGASFTLATTASTPIGGGTVTITWFMQTSSGQVNVGTGTSISVTPSVTTLYLAVATNSCGSSNSAQVTVTIGGCAAPTLTQPGDQAIGLGSSTTLTVSASGGTLHYQWFQGVAGDTSHPIGTDSANVITGPLFETTSFWVKVSNDCSTSTTSSSTITVTVVPARRRPARH